MTNTQDVNALSTSRTPKHLLIPQIEVIRQLVDSLIADVQTENVEANLYSARLHLSMALNEALNLSKTAVH